MLLDLTGVQFLELNMNLTPKAAYFSEKTPQPISPLSGGLNPLSGPKPLLYRLRSVKVEYGPSLNPFPERYIVSA